MTAPTQTTISFLFLGLAIGAALGWAARGTVLEPDHAFETPAQTPQIKERDSPKAFYPAPGAGKSESQSADAPARILDVSHYSDTETTIEGHRSNQEPPQASANSTTRRAIPVSDAHAHIVHKQFTEDETSGERKTVREVLESEATDDSWSHFMEQTLQLFISSHTEAAKFSIFHIECRTTICEIQAIGFNDSTAPDWSRILYDMTLEPWYEFGQVGTSSDIFQGQLAILTRLSRRDENSASTPSD